MKKYFKPFLIAFAVTIILHLLSFLVLELTNQINEQEIANIFKNLPLSFSLFFFPIFFSFFFFDKNKKNSSNILKSGLLSIFLVGLFEIIYFQFFVIRPNFKFFDAVFGRVVFISFFISFFSTVFQLIRIKIRRNQKTTLNNISFSWKYVLLIPFTGALIYMILIFILIHYSNAILVWFKLFPLGVLLSILSIQFFKSRFYRQKKYNVILFYIISIIVFCFFSLISEVLTNLAYRVFSEVLIRSIIPSVIIFFPYFLFVIILIHLYYLTLITKQEETVLKQQTLESQLNYQQLKNQISPHFLFNNINVLTSLIEENPKKAVQFSENLSHIYRYFLEQEKEDVVMVKDEINFAKAYLELLKDRFENGFTFKINIDEKVKEKYIVSTILQQVLENVIKHNEINENHHVEVIISSTENFIIVENNKNAKLTSIKTSQKGIENIRKRIAFFTDEKVMIHNTEDSYKIQLPILETI